tara:strand:- start:788 stop:1366 length:579 start_codon:yes stop_codon:yes gene_type:complete
MEFKGRLSSTVAVELPDWATLVRYIAGDCVLQAGAMYLCNTSHTAGTFATDVTTKWTAVAAASNTVIEKFILPLTPALAKALSTTPQEIAPAPGTLKTYRFIAGSERMVHNGVNFNFPADMEVYYETSTDTIVVMTAPNDAADFLRRIDKGGASGDPMSFNDRVMLKALTGDATLGDGDWTLQLLFSIDDYN